MIPVWELLCSSGSTIPTLYLGLYDLNSKKLHALVLLSLVGSERKATQHHFFFFLFLARLLVAHCCHGWRIGGGTVKHKLSIDQAWEERIRRGRGCGAIGFTGAHVPPRKQWGFIWFLPCDGIKLQRLDPCYGIEEDDDNRDGRRFWSSGRRILNSDYYGKLV